MFWEKAWFHYLLDRESELSENIIFSFGQVKFSQNWNTLLLEPIVWELIIWFYFWQIFDAEI